MNTMDMENKKEVELDALEAAAGGTNIVEMDEDEPNLENPLGNAILVAAAIGLAKAYAKGIIPKTFEEFYNNVYSPNKTAIDIAVCAASSLTPIAIGGYLACDKREFWNHVYNMIT